MKQCHYINVYFSCRFHFIIVIMADFGEMEVAAPMPAPVAFVPEMPEIKLFGKWSLDEVQLNDMSLQVSVYQGPSK